MMEKYVYRDLMGASSAENKWGIRELQNCILNIAVYLDRFCQEHGVVYYLMGGSALGAVRHKGFIPWDDDLDVFMTWSDYQNFRSAFRQQGDKEHFYLQEMGANHGMLTYAKLRLNASTLIEDEVRHLDIHHGVFIDIFILHTCPSEPVRRYWQYLWARYLVVKGLANRANRRGSYIRRAFVACLGILPKRFLLHFACKQIFRFEGSKASDYCHFLGRASIRKGVYEKNLFGSPRRCQFEEVTLNVPNQVEKYLRERWGDYMKLPSIEEIQHFQHSQEWSVSDAFALRKEGTYADEKYLI